MTPKPSDMTTITIPASASFAIVKAMAANGRKITPRSGKIHVLNTVSKASLPSQINSTKILAIGAKLDLSISSPLIDEPARSMGGWTER